MVIVIDRQFLDAIVIFIVLVNVALVGLTLVGWLIGQARLRLRR